MKMNWNSDAGFTLIELMITITVLGVLIAIAAPSFTTMIKAQRVRTLASDLHADLTLARSEAIKRNINVEVRAQDTSDWSKGWSVQTLQAGNLIALATRPPMSNGIAASGIDDSIVFGAAGRLNGIDTTQSLQVKHVDIPSSYWRCVTINIGGRPNVVQGNCS